MRESDRPRAPSLAPAPVNCANYSCNGARGGVRLLIDGFPGIYFVLHLPDRGVNTIRLSAPVIPL